MVFLAAIKDARRVPITDDWDMKTSSSPTQPDRLHPVAFRKSQRSGSPRFAENLSAALAEDPTVLEHEKNKTLQAIVLQGFIMVRDLGLEPRTQGLRIPCSTN